MKASVADSKMPEPWILSSTKRLNASEVTDTDTHTHIITYLVLTYGPHKAVAEVSNHNEPIGRKSGSQLVRKIRKSMDVTFSCFVLN